MAGRTGNRPPDYSEGVREYSKGANLGLALIAIIIVVALLMVLIPEYALVIGAIGVVLFVLVGIASIVHLIRVVKIGLRLRQAEVKNAPGQGKDNET